MAGLNLGPHSVVIYVCILSYTLIHLFFMFKKLYFLVSRFLYVKNYKKKQIS